MSVGGGASAGDVGWALTSRGVGASVVVAEVVVEEDLFAEPDGVFFDAAFDPLFEFDEVDDGCEASRSGRGLMLARVSRPTEHWQLIVWTTTWVVA